jgi:hypothetical protein
MSFIIHDIRHLCEYMNHTNYQNSIPGTWIILLIKNLRIENFRLMNTLMQPFYIFQINQSRSKLKLESGLECQLFPYTGSKIVTTSSSQFTITMPFHWIE